MDIKRYLAKVDDFEPAKCFGKVTQVAGLLVEARLPKSFVGEICYIEDDFPTPLKVPCEVVGIKGDRSLLMPYTYVQSVSVGSKVRSTRKPFELRIGPEILGRIVGGMGSPIDGKPPYNGPDIVEVGADPPRPLDRPRIQEILASGIRAIDTMMTWGKGQRLGIFAGSGVGKSTLMGMLARGTNADVNVIALIGERGREVKEFIERDLGDEGLKRSIVVVVTGDESPIMRVKGTQVAHAIAEYFRDLGKDVLLMQDSLTRYTYALREIGLSLGEPPTTRGYTPSVYARIPQLCERCGTTVKGTITGVYTVLVEGDDMNEPVSDIARSVLDGHLTLDRKLAAQAHYPPINVLHSISRAMTDIVTPEHRQASQWAREVLSTFTDAEELINLGAYTKGNNPKIDHAIEFIDPLRSMLKQDIFDVTNFKDALETLMNLYNHAQQHKQSVTSSRMDAKAATATKATKK